MSFFCQILPVPRQVFEIICFYTIEKDNLKTNWSIYNYFFLQKMAYKEQEIFGQCYEKKSCSIKEIVHSYGHDTLRSYSDVQMKISLFCIDATLKITFNQIASVL